MTDNPTVPDEAASENAANELLRRHERDEPEANITTAVRDFLIATRLVESHEIDEENPPSPDSTRRAVDLTALDTFVEVKRRIGMAKRGVPDAENVAQLDGYLESSQRDGTVRMGILTDGKYWVLRWPGAGEPKLTKPYAITLEDANSWRALHEWLRDEALVALQNIEPTHDDIEKHFGINSPRYLQDIDTLRALYEQARDNSSIAVKRRLWEDLLRTALGEIAQSQEEMDDLFIRHTYLTTVIGIVVQAAFGVDIRQLAANDPHDLVLGQRFRSRTGIEGVVESDFFAWPTEIGGGPFLTTLARRISRFNWRKVPENVAAILYEAVIPPDDRRQLGEYYTPDWLARTMVRELVTDPLNQSVLDPACGSGTFLTEAIARFIEAADNNADPLDRYTASDLLNRLRERVIGIDVHPVAVHLARAAWVLAATPLFERIDEQGSALPSSNFSAPVYLGDSLQLQIRGDMFSKDIVTIPVRDADNTELVFPRSLVERAENFDNVIASVTHAIEHGDDPSSALDDAGLENGERETLAQAVATLQRLHKEGRNHIWAYYTRNMVRPVTLANQKVDIVIGNPPWITYNKTIADLRTGLEQFSKDVYGIWQGGQYATHMDVAGLFFTRSVDLYLEDGGIIGMVMPHSALQAGQYAAWRTGVWNIGIDGGVLAVDFTHKFPWDLYHLKPNTFFPLPASVAFARRVVAEGSNDPPAKPLAGTVERWTGETKKQNFGRVPVTITGTGESPYADRARQGATIVPRRLHFVEETENPSPIKAPGTVTVNPRLGSKDKAPWRGLDLSAITGQTIEETHVFDVHLGETLVPYATLEPLKAVLPIRPDNERLSRDGNPLSVLDSSGLQSRMRDRWRTVSRLWEANRAKANKLSLLGQIDYWDKLTAQLEWQQDNREMPVRILYSASGTPTATIISDGDALIDYTGFWLACFNKSEANYIVAVINSTALYEAMEPLMPKGMFGPRHVQKHLWKLPIPRFDESVNLHRELAQAGEAAAKRVAEMLPYLRAKEEAQGRSLTVTTARREIRKWLRQSKEGKDVERLVKKLLSS